MTTYTTITNGQVDLDSPVTQTLITALRDNPLAIAEQTSGAPPVGGVWHFYNEATFGAGDGVIYDSSTDGVVAAVETPTFESGYEYRIVGRAVDHNQTNEQIGCALFQTATSSYTSALTISGLFGSSGTDLLEFDVYIPNPSLAKQTQGFTYASWTKVGVSLTATLQARGVATTSAISKARIAPTAGSISQGVIYLLRRRVSF